LNLEGISSGQRDASAALLVRFQPGSGTPHAASACFVLHRITTTLSAIATGAAELISDEGGWSSGAANTRACGRMRPSTGCCHANVWWMPTSLRTEFYLSFG